MQAFRRLRELHQPYILDLIPAYASLTVVCMMRWYCTGNPIVTPVKKIRELIAATLDGAAEIIACPPPRLLEILYAYHPSLGPDLQGDGGKQKRFPGAYQFELHTEQTYTVYMLGFLPGFPYMGSVHDLLVTPRLKQPAQGTGRKCRYCRCANRYLSAGIAGGWNIIVVPLCGYLTLLRQPYY